MPVAVAYAVEGAAQNPMATGIASFFPFIVLIAVFYFLLIRPQQKKSKDHASMLSKIEQGDNVVTIGGLHGKVMNVRDDNVTLEIAEKVRVKVQKTAIQARKIKGDIQPSK
jgi:preprotein translocase subunit YajC